MVESNSTLGYVAPTSGEYKFGNVPYRGKVFSRARLFEQLTPSMNQAGLSEFYETEKAKGNPVPTDLPLLMSIFNTAYDLKDSPEFKQDADRFRQFAQGIMRSVYPNTLTRVQYASSGKDRVIHNHRTSDEYSLSEDVVGPDGEICIDYTDAVRALTSISDPEKVRNVLSWINKTPAWLWRVNSKPRKNLDERVVRLYADSGGLDVGAGGGPQGGCPAFRVLLEE